jgi:ferrous iron transport protein B
VSNPRLNLPAKLILIGCPNSGKTTLFNWLTGLRHKTVNYPGSTVDYSEGRSLEVDGHSIAVIDTPGTYSLLAQGDDEAVTIRVLQQLVSEGGYHILLIIDASRFAKHHTLFNQLQTLGLPFSVALTMVDILKSDGVAVDIERLQSQLGVAIFPVDGRLGGGTREILRETFKRADRQQPQKLGLETLTTSVSEVHRKKWQEIYQNYFRAPISQNEMTKNHRARTQALDKILLHPILGLMIFFLIMFLTFASVFWLASPFMDAIDNGFAWLGEVLAPWLGEGLLADLIANGVIAGAGSVLVFVPQIAILFIGLTLLEDTGYLARAATLVDRPLQAIGLSGRSFVPLMSGYACAIPAMMATRSVGGARAKFLTLFIIPLMSCSARLPVYALLLALLFPGAALQSGLMLTGIYFLSLVVGALASAVLSRFLKQQESSLFLMDLPLYRRPAIPAVFATALLRTKSYVWRAGPTIFVLSLLIWSATTFPRFEISDPSQRLEQSFAAMVGKGLEPLLSPMGLDWRVGVGLVSAFAAREIFVSSLAIVFHATADGAEVSDKLLQNLQSATRADGTLVFTPGSILALIVFFMIALQCMSTLAVAKGEFNSWRWPLVQLVVFNSIAYVLATLIYQSWRLFLA